MIREAISGRQSGEALKSQPLVNWQACARMRRQLCQLRMACRRAGCRRARTKGFRMEGSLFVGATIDWAKKFRDVFQGFWPVTTGRRSRREAGDWNWPVGWRVRKIR